MGQFLLQYWEKGVLKYFTFHGFIVRPLAQHICRITYPWAVLDNKIKHSEHFHLSSLVSIQPFHLQVHECLKIGIVRLHNNRVPTLFKIMLPVLEYLYNSQQFPIMGFIACFDICHFLQSKGNWMPMAIIFLQLGDDTADCKARSISFYLNLKFWVEMPKQ